MKLGRLFFLVSFGLCAFVRCAFADVPVAPVPLEDEVTNTASQLQERRSSQLHEEFRRTKLYEPKLTELFRERDIPVALIGLGFVESSFNPNAVGKGAVGIWQLEAGTARKFGIKLAKGKDARRDVLASTECTIRYLQFLHEKFHDWLLVIVAFKLGDGNLEKALRKNGVNTLMGLFGGGGLKRETHDYLFSVLAHGVLYQEYLKRPG